MASIEQLVRKNLRDLRPYCVPKRSVPRSDGGKDCIRLDANESPWQNKMVIDANTLNRYPQPLPDATVSAVARYYQVNTNQITFSRGSDESIDHLIRLFCDAGRDAIITCPPTFCMYEAFARMQGANVIEIPLLRDRQFCLNRDAIVASVDQNVKLIFLCSPNNPTGTLIDADKIVYLCKKLDGRCIIVIDEAYIEFAESQSASQLIDTCENLVVLRTLSKAFGFAGARIGALLGNAGLIKQLAKVRPPYALPSFTAHFLQLAFSEKALSVLDEQIVSVRQERRRLTEALSSMPLIKDIWESQANFILIEVRDADRVVRDLSDRGIFIKRIEDSDVLQNGIRITVGKSDEISRLIAALETYR